MARLEEICSLITDGSHFSPEDEGVGYPMFSVKDMTPNGFNISGCKKIGEEAYKKLVANGCKPLNDDVVVAKDGSYLKTAFVIKGNPEITLLSSIAILRPKIDLVVPEYLSYFLKSDAVYRTVSLNYITGTALKRIILKGIRKIEVDLPDIGEQEQRAQRLSKVDYLCQLRKQQLAKLDELVKARFVEMFGDINVNNKKWVTYPLGELCTIVRGGSPRPIERYLGGTIPWIKIGDATTGENIYLNSTKEYIIQEGVKKSRMIKAGSLIFANCGVSLGFARIITFDGCIHDGWLAMEDIDEKLDKIFLLYSLNQMTEYFRKTAPAGTQPNLNTNIMKMHRQIVPPMEMQKAFISFVKCADRQKQTVQQSLEKLELMKKSLMQEYFG